MKCPKCNYNRKSEEYAPEWECPNCGICYDKYLIAKLRKLPTSRLFDLYCGSILDQSGRDYMLSELENRGYKLEMLEKQKLMEHNRKSTKLMKYLNKKEGPLSAIFDFIAGSLIGFFLQLQIIYFLEKNGIINHNPTSSIHDFSAFMNIFIKSTISPIKFLFSPIFFFPKEQVLYSIFTFPILIGIIILVWKIFDKIRRPYRLIVFSIFMLFWYMSGYFFYLMCFLLICITGMP